jgi:V/A-type H+-transporting ATPase subunit D
MNEVKPTRSELIAVKKRIMLAKSGHALLKKKRDGLMREFFALLRKSELEEEKIAKAYRIAQSRMNKARMMEPELKIRSLVWAIREKPLVSVETRNIIGVKVPFVSGKKVSKKLQQRGYEVFNSIVLDEAAESYELLIDAMMKVAETQIALRRIVKEIEKTKRRVNALEFSMIPGLASQRKAIASRLEEMERENFTRLKLIKAHLESNLENDIESRRQQNVQDAVQLQEG